MQRVVFLLLGVGLFLVVVAGALGQHLAPAALVPDAAPPPVAEVNDGSLFASFAAPALVDVRTSIHVLLPDSWQSSLVDAKTMQTQLSQAATDASANASLSANAAMLSSGLAEEATIFAAVTGNGSNPSTDSTLSVIAMKRNGLRLEQYLEETAALLASQGAQIRFAQVETTWRADRLPVGVLHYTLPATALVHGAAPTDGLQVAAYSVDGAQLILFTFTTPAAPLAELSDRFGNLVRTATFIEGFTYFTRSNPIMPAAVPPGYTRGPILFLGPIATPGGEQALLQRFWTDAGGYGARILLVVAEQHDPLAELIANRLSHWGAEHVEAMCLTRRADAQSSAQSPRIEHATAILMVNGEPRLLARRLGGTPVAQAIRRANARGKTVAALGESAGILCQHMLVGGTPPHIAHVPGLGLLNRLAIAPQPMRPKPTTLRFDQSHEDTQLAAYLLAAATPNPFLICVSLERDTGLAVYADATLEVFGSHDTLLLDASDGSDDLDQVVTDGAPNVAQMVAAGIKLHQLTAGHTFNFDQRLVASPADTDLPGPFAPETSKSSF